MTQSLAFVFPGQGSQAVGMLSELADRYAVVRTTFEEASQILGYDLW
ncbi:malonyl CoA-acyl carrier protein transacylase, partial [Oceanospirillum sp. HFRX-1_2]